MSRFRFAALAFTILFAGVLAMAQTNQPATSGTAGNGQPAILTPADTAKIMPATVFFKGQSAPIQARNSAGVRLADQHLILVSLVDTSGYSSQVQSRYQLYLIAESPVDIGGHPLVAGAYGCGFVNGSFVVMDVGGTDLFTVPAASDADLKHPRPLQILPASDTQGSYRLYEGREYVTFRAGSGS